MSKTLPYAMWDVINTFHTDTISLLCYMRLWDQMDKHSLLGQIEHIPRQDQGPTLIPFVRTGFNHILLFVGGWLASIRLAMDIFILRTVDTPTTIDQLCSHRNTKKSDR